MQMKRKLLLLLVSISFVVLTTMPITDIVSKPIQQQAIETMGHGTGA